MKLYMKFLIGIFFLISIYSCKAQNIYSDERVLYTLENYKFCLFYDEQLIEINGIDLRRLDCELSLDRRYFTDESKELLMSVIKKDYSDQFIWQISKDRVLFNYESELNQISEKLKDSSNFSYSGKFNKRQYVNFEERKELLEKLLSSTQKDTVQEYKNLVELTFKNFQDFKISNSLIYAVAFIEDKNEAIPFLKSLLNDTSHINSSAIKLSLAKLKVKPYYTEQLKQLKNEVNYIISSKEDVNKSDLNIFYSYPRAGLLLDKKAIYTYSKVLEAKYFDAIDHGDVLEISIPIRALIHLLHLVDNNDFKQRFMDEKGYPKNYAEINKKDIDWAINWFRLNKDEIIPNESHIPLLNNKL